MLQKIIQVSHRFKQVTVTKQAENVFDIHYFTFSKEETWMTTEG